MMIRTHGSVLDFRAHLDTMDYMEDARNTGGSQFFICHNRQNTQHLDGNHTCFGRVIEGLEIVDRISQGDKINSMTII